MNTPTKTAAEAIQQTIDRLALDAALTALDYLGGPAAVSAVTLARKLRQDYSTATEKETTRFAEAAYWLALTTELREIIARAANNWVTPLPKHHAEIVAWRADNIAQHRINRRWTSLVDEPTLAYLVQDVLAQVWPAPAQ